MRKLTHYKRGALSSIGEEEVRKGKPSLTPCSSFSFSWHGRSHGMRDLSSAFLTLERELKMVPSGDTQYLSILPFVMPLFLFLEVHFHPAGNANREERRRAGRGGGTTMTSSMDTKHGVSDGSGSLGAVGIDAIGDAKGDGSSSTSSFSFSSPLSSSVSYPFKSNTLSMCFRDLIPFIQRVAEKSIFPQGLVRGSGGEMVRNWVELVEEVVKRMRHVKKRWSDGWERGDLVVSKRERERERENH
jgi:hypothetical protein